MRSFTKGTDKRMFECLKQIWFSAGLKLAPENTVCVARSWTSPKLEQ